MWIELLNWNETWKKTINRWPKKDILATLNGGSTDNKNSMQNRIDALYDSAIKAKESGDREAYDDFMRQIRENTNF